MNYEFHDLANLFPMMPADELQELAEDIKANGQRNPIVVFEGKILDGRNRYAACQLIGIDPIEVPFKGKDALSYVLSINLHRRHLTTSQRAMVAAKLANMVVGGREANSANLQDCPKVSQPQAAKLLNVSPRIVADAKEIEREAPELAEKVSSGEITVRAAKEEIKARAEDPAQSLDAKPIKEEVYTSETMAGLKRYWNKATKREKSEFLTWIKE